MHDSWEVCGACDGEPSEEDEQPCYRCGGAGVLEYHTERPPSKYAECPRCRNLMARPGRDGEVWCGRCRGFVKPFDEADVLRNPQIIERR